MNYIDNEEKSRLPGWLCVEDAKKRNAENESLYTEAEKEQADLFAQRVRNAYIRSRVYLNYREKFIAIKVDKPSVSDKISVIVNSLNQDAEALGYTVVKTKSNIVYRLFPKK